MSDELRQYTDIYNEYFNSNNYNLLNLMIIDEIQCQLQDKISDENYNKIFYKVRNCYLKSSESDLWQLTNYCIKNVDKIDDMGCWEIINYSSIL